jgi:membrane-bound lytic murein transglycosylase D
MAPGDVLSVGRELVVWTKEPAAAAQTSPSTPTATPAIANAQTSASSLATAARTDATLASPRTAGAGAAATNVSALKSPQVRQVTYVVRPGDSLYSISRRFRVSVTDLREWNGVAAEKVIKPGQRLKMFVDVTEQSG